MSSNSTKMQGTLESAIRDQSRVFLLQNALIGITGVFLVFIGFTMYKWKMEQMSLVNAWTATMLLIIVARLAFLVLYRIRKQKRASLVPDRQVYYGYWLTSALQAPTWGSAALLFYPADPISQVFFLVVLIGIAVSSIPAFAGSLSLSIIYAGGVLGILEVKLLSLPLATYGFLAMLNPVLIALLSAIALSINRQLVNLLTLSYKNKQLALLEEASKKSIVEFSERLSLKTEEIEQIQQRMSRMVAIASRDLRYQLVTIYQFTRLLNEDSCSSEAAPFIRQTLHETSGTCLQLVEDLLAITGEKRGLKELSLESVDLAKVLERAITTVEQQARAKHISLQRSVDSLQKVRIDSDKVERVLTKLIDNAVRFSPEYSVIRIEACATEGKMQLFIRDCGNGIELNQLTKLFDTKAQGNIEEAIVGLPWSRKTIRAQGGDLMVENNPNSGCTFSLSLPLAD